MRTTVTRACPPLLPPLLCPFPCVPDALHGFSRFVRTPTVPAPQLSCAVTGLALVAGQELPLDRLRLGPCAMAGMVYQYRVGRGRVCGGAPANSATGMLRTGER